MRTVHAFGAALLLTVIAALPAASQQVEPFDDASPAAERYVRAVNAADGRQADVWIGFSVTRMMRENSVMGRFVGAWRSSPTLDELLDPTAGRPDPSVEEAAREALREIDNREADTPDRLVPTRVAILLRRDADGSIRDVAYSNMSMSFDPGDRALYWLGHVDAGPAFDLLRNLYADHRSDTADSGEDLISAIGLLNNEAVHAWLFGIVDSDRPANEREQAVFWLGESDRPRYARRLHVLADEDASEDVREQAVFSLYRMSSDDALESLVALAREADHEESREKARFWLAHRAGDRLVNGSDAAEPTDLEKQAVFALSRLDDDTEAVVELSSIARTHANPHIRKQALFWLGQRGDEASLDTILEILRDGGENR